MDTRDEMQAMLDEAYQKWHKGEYYLENGMFYNTETGEAICPDALPSDCRCETDEEDE